MEKLGHEKYSLSGMCSAAMRHDLEQEVSKLLRELDDMTEQRDALAEALQWYEKKVSDCRKVTPEGHFARYKLDEDGGKIAAKALAATKGGSDG